MRNAATNASSNATAMMLPLRDGFSVENLYKPSVPDNITSLRVFYDDQ